MASSPFASCTPAGKDTVRLVVLETEAFRMLSVSISKATSRWNATRRWLNPGHFELAEGVIALKFALVMLG